MEQSRLEAFRSMLILRRQEIEELNLANCEAAGTVTLDQSKVGRLSRMDALQAQQMAQETTRRRQLELQKIESALRRIDKDEYGYCFVCGNEIPRERLTFDPASTRCIGCVDS